MAFVTEGHVEPQWFQAPRIWVVQDMVDAECPELFCLRCPADKALVLKILPYVSFESPVKKVAVVPFVITSIQPVVRTKVVFSAVQPSTGLIAEVVFTNHL